jgi:ribosomal protein L4
MTHQFAANGDQFPGHLGHGGTCQQLHHDRFAEENERIIAQAEVAPPAQARQADAKPPTRASRKSAPRARRKPRS